MQNANTFLKPLIIAKIRKPYGDIYGLLLPGQNPLLTIFLLNLLLITNV